MRATAVAQPNIALIKYWGKRDLARNLPAVGSISLTLRDLQTSMQIELRPAAALDELILNGCDNTALLPRLSQCLDNVIGSDRPRAGIVSTSNFPVAAGLASSASAFAACVVAAAAAAQRSCETDELARLAGRASGSAARSLYGGIAELRNLDDDIAVETVSESSRWPLDVVVAITSTGPKATGSTKAMEISRKTSPFYSDWIERQEDDLTTARQAISVRDFEQLAAIAEHNCLKMHSVMWTSRPPMVYWNAATLQCLETVRQLQREGRSVFFTMDAGPQVKAVCLPEETERVRAALADTPGVKQIMVTSLGEGARLVGAT